MGENLFIGIIAILASMLLPSLKHAMDAAKTISCSSLLKQHGIVAQAYTIDYDGWLPYTLTKKYMWQNGWLPEYYGKNWKAELRNCPGRDKSWPQGPGVFDCSYGSNKYYGVWLWQIPRIKFTQVKYPSSTLHLCDVQGIISDYSTYYIAVDGKHANVIRGARHQKKLNVLHSDGHVKGYTINDFTNPHVLIFKVAN